MLKPKPLLAAVLLVPATLLGLLALGWTTRSLGNVLFAEAVFAFNIAGAIGYFVIPPILFRVIGNNLWRGVDRVPKFSLLTLAIGIAASTWYLAESWSYGIEYQQHFVTVLIVYANVLIALLLVYLGLRNRLRPTYASNLLFHWMLIAWLATVAFPYFGEVP